MLGQWSRQNSKVIESSRVRRYYRTVPLMVPMGLHPQCGFMCNGNFPIHLCCHRNWMLQNHYRILRMSSMLRINWFAHRRHGLEMERGWKNLLWSLHWKWLHYQLWRRTILMEIWQVYVLVPNYHVNPNWSRLLPHDLLHYRASRSFHEQLK